MQKNIFLLPTTFYMTIIICGNLLGIVRDFSCANFILREQKGYVVTKFEDSKLNGVVRSRSDRENLLKIVVQKMKKGHNSAKNPKKCFKYIQKRYTEPKS